MDMDFVTAIMKRIEMKTMSSVREYVEDLFAFHDIANYELVEKIVKLVDCAETSAWSRGYNEGYLDGSEEDVVN